MAKAKGGFGGGRPETGSVVVAMRVVEIEDDGLPVAVRGFFFVEDRIGNDVLFAGPVSEVKIAAACATEGEVSIRLGVGRFLADGAVVFHLGRIAAQDSFYHR